MKLPSLALGGLLTLLAHAAQMASAENLRCVMYLTGSVLASFDCSRRR